MLTALEHGWISTPKRSRLRLESCPKAKPLHSTPACRLAPLCFPDVVFLDLFVMYFRFFLLFMPSLLPYFRRWQRYQTCCFFFFTTIITPRHNNITLLDIASSSFSSIFLFRREALTHSSIRRLLCYSISTSTCLSPKIIPTRSNTRHQQLFRSFVQDAFSFFFLLQPPTTTRHKTNTTSRSTHFCCPCSALFFSRRSPVRSFRRSSVLFYRLDYYYCGTSVAVLRDFIRRRRILDCLRLVVVGLSG